VLVVEKNDYIGGAAVTREMHEGWFYSSCSYVCSMMRQAIHRDLDLTRHGLLLVPYLGTVNFSPSGDRTLMDYTTRRRPTSNCAATRPTMPTPCRASRRISGATRS
jgi:phytoene dehydrogenase-like protein